MAMPPVEEISWFSAGGFAGWPEDAAWRTLAVAGAIGLVLVVVSYRHLLVAVPPWRRSFLCLLRLALWLGLLLLLTAPTRIERTYGRPERHPRPLAILVDRSDSMTERDNRQQRRLDDALAQWQRVEPAARKTFAPVTSYAFAQGLTPIPDLAAPGASTIPGDRTDLFSSLQDVLAHAPAGGWGGIVALTDGLDTSGADLAEAQNATARAALTTGTPLFFVVGRNRAIEPAFFHLREFNAPVRAEPHSLVRLDAVFESYQTAASTLPVQLTVTGKTRDAGSIRLEAGRHLENWAVQGAAEQPGTLTFELQAGAEKARTEVKVASPHANGILYVQGVLDWDYRFLADILKRNQGFTLTPVFAFPFPPTARPPGILSELPSPEQLSSFGVIILANVPARQIPPDRQAAISRWVNDGGVLICLMPDDAATRGFSGSELEKALPVVFRPAGPGGISPTPEAPHAKLTPAMWETSPRTQEVFGANPEASLADQAPRFTTVAHVERAKPGAEVLARHPTEAGRDGARAILLAIQRYGRGESAVLATDALWRWRLDQPSANRGIELFWGNLFTWLLRDRDTEFHFEHPPVRAPIDQEVALHVGGTVKGPLRLEATLAGQPAAELTELPADETSRVFRWHPSVAGFWQIEAKDERGDTIHCWLNIDPAPAKRGELPAAAPDEQRLRTLAAQTGGALLDGSVPAAWQQKPPPIQLLSERRESLWHREGIFAALLGIYGVEMLLRRRWRLL
jgi:hypothetical protein